MLNNLVTKPTVHMMIDIETWDTRPTAAIRSIAYKFFELDSPPQEPTTSDVVLHLTNYETQEGRTSSRKVEEWWHSTEELRLQNSILSEAKYLYESVSLREALIKTNNDIARADYIWANSPAFDLVILRDAMEYYGIEPNWSFREELDLRTLRTIVGVSLLRPDCLPKHNAKADVAFQVAEAIECIYMVKL